MLTIYFILWRRSQRRKAAKKRKEEEEYAMQQRYAVADCDSEVGTEVGSVHSDVTMVQQGTRGYVHRGVGDVTLMPQCHIFESRLRITSQNTCQSRNLF